MVVQDPVLQRTRAIRLLRLLRTVKLTASTCEIVARIQSEDMRTLLGVARIMGFMLVLSHMIACGWYALAVWQGRNGVENWLDSQAPERQEDLVYIYTSALHWALTQFTPASMEIVPQSKLERIMAACVIISAVVLFSSLVSSITNAMTTLDRRRANQSRQSSVLRLFLADSSISQPLVARIWRYLEKKKNQSNRVHRVDVELLNVLPMTLLKDICTEAYQPVVQCHPFFNHFAESCSSEMQKVCLSAISERSLRPDDELFGVGLDGVGMFVIGTGSIFYDVDIPRDTDYAELRAVKQFSKKEHFATLLVGDWLCEGSLWMPWVTCGRAIATHERADIFLVEAGKFQKYALETVMGFVPLSKYAALFAEHLTKSLHVDPPRHLTDIWWSTNKWKDVFKLPDVAFKVFDSSLSDSPLAKLSDRSISSSNLTRPVSKMLSLFSSVSSSLPSSPSPRFRTPSSPKRL